MKSRNHSQKNAKQATTKVSGGTAGVGKKLRRISISDDSDSSSVDLESQMPEFLDLHEYDLTTKCPTFKQVCDRDSSHTPALNADELDSVQFELERLLFHTVTRSKCISDCLNDLSDVRGVASSSSSAGPSATGSNLRSSSNAASQLVDKQRSTKVKFFPAVSTVAVASALCTDAATNKRTALIASLSPLKIKPPKLNRSDHVTTSERSALSPGSSRLSLWPHNQMPEKFVHFIDNYAGRIPGELIDKLRQLADESDRSKSGEYYEIPDLGKHYSLRKSDPALSPTVESNHKSAVAGTVGSSKDKPNKNASKSSIKLKNGESPADHPAKLSSTRVQSSRQASAKTKSNPSVDKDEDQFALGPLTERLVQALIEENAFEPTFDELDCKSDLLVQNSIPNTTPSKNLLKSLNLGNMAALERRIRKELEEQGLLNFDDDLLPEADGTPGPENEVLTELKQRQKELDSLQSTNFERLNSLIAKCEIVVEQQNVEDHLKSADDQILELFSRFYGIVPVVRKPSTKKEKDQLLKALKDREKLLDQLKNLKVS